MRKTNVRIMAGRDRRLRCPSSKSFEVAISRNRASPWWFTLFASLNDFEHGGWKARRPHGLMRGRHVKYDMRHITSCMHVIQTELSDPEHSLLARYARDQGKTIKEVLRELVRSLVLSDRVRPTDPIFSKPPVGAKRGLKDTTSSDHDRVLYGGKS